MITYEIVIAEMKKRQEELLAEMKEFKSNPAFFIALRELYIELNYWLDRFEKVG